VQQDEERRAEVSQYQLLSASSSSSPSSPAPAWGPPHKIQSLMNSSNVGPFHRVQSFRNSCSPADPPWAAVPARKRAPEWVPLHRPQLQEPALAHALHGCSLLHGISTGCSVEVFHHDVLQGLQGNLCSGAWSTSSPSFFTHLGVHRAVSHTFSSRLSHALLCSTFPPLLNTISPLRWVCWSRRNWLCSAQGSPGLPSQRTPCSHPTASTLLLTREQQQKKP